MPCTPTPPYVSGSTDQNIEQWLADFQDEGPDEQWRMLVDVCSGRTQLRRNGLRIACREEWPSFVQAFCADPPAPPPPPPPAQCTPPPAPLSGAERQDAGAFLSEWVHAPPPDQYELLALVCQGALVLTRDGVDIACREEWPSVVQTFCLTPPPPDDVYDPLRSDAETVEAAGSMSTEFRRLYIESQTDLRRVGRTAWAAASHLRRWRTGQPLPPRGQHRR